MGDWIAQAACAGEPQVIFYGTGESRQMTATEVRLARTFCGPCPVRRECLAHALLTEEQHGVWGGLTPKERQSLTRRVP